MASETVDPYRQYPWRLFGYTNAVVRPIKDVIPKQAYQASLGIMHLYFLANSYDYAISIDSKSMTRSAFDCYSWHCITSWVGPALVVDSVARICRRSTANRFVPILGAYVGLSIVGPVLDRLANWYFYGFWSAGNKSKPTLKL